MKEETTPTAGLQVEDIRRVTPLIRALYMHQPVMMHPDWEAFNDDRPTMVEAHHFDDSYSKRWKGSYLLLRPLSSITDDEAVQVAKMLWPMNSRLWYLKDIEEFFEENSLNHVPADVYLFLIQYAFAVDYYDSIANTTITVEMQVAAGIIKLKS